MKLKHLHESREMLDKPQLEWLKKFVEVYEDLTTTSRADFSNFYVENGKICCTQNVLSFSNFHEGQDNIPPYIKFGKVLKITFEKGVILHSFKLFPEEAESITIREMFPLKGLSRQVKKCNSIHISYPFISGSLEFFKLKTPLEKVTRSKAIANTSLSKSKEFIDYMNFVRIVNKNLKEGDIFQFQDEMVEAGLESFL